MHLLPSALATIGILAGFVVVCFIVSVLLEWRRVIKRMNAQQPSQAELIAWLLRNPEYADEGAPVLHIKDIQDSNRKAA